MAETPAAARKSNRQRKTPDPYVIMTRLAEDVPVGADRLLFLPYLMGERSRTPTRQPQRFVGLSARHGRALIRAVMGELRSSA